MWRFYTRGWGPRAWWYWFKGESWPMFVAWHLPRRVALWTFIRVYGWDGHAPGADYRRVYHAWEAGEAGRCQALLEVQREAAAAAVQAASGWYDGPVQQTAGAFGAEPYVSALGYHHGQRREPTHIDLADPRFDILWNRLKHLEITGNDIAALLDELDTAPALGV